MLFKRIFKIFLILSFLICFTMPANAKITISPTSFSYKIKPGANIRIINGSFSVSISDSEPIRFKVYPEYFSKNNDYSSEKGKKAVDSLQEKIRFNPMEFTVTPDRVQKVRFSILDAQSLPDGESRVTLMLEDIKTREQILGKTKSGVVASITIKSRLAIPVYVDKGTVIKSFVIDNADIKQNAGKYTYNITLTSKGNSRINASGKLYILKDKKLIDEATLPKKTIHVNANDTLSGEIPTSKLTSGEKYSVRFDINYTDFNGKTKTVKKEMDFPFGTTSTLL